LLTTEFDFSKAIQQAIQQPVTFTAI